MRRLLLAALAAFLAAAMPLAARAQAPVWLSSPTGTPYTTANPLPVTVTAGGGGTVVIKPGPYTIVPLDIASVTTGGTAVVALSAGHASAGGFIITANAAGFCVDQTTTAGVATGTPSTTVCTLANLPFQLVPNAHAVSVNSSANTVTLAGEGLQ